jgi:hypothetical protein
MIAGNKPYETNAEYHADYSHLSNSMKEFFLSEGADAYYRTYITKEMVRKSTESQVIGQLTHSFILEPERTELEFVREPDWSSEIRKPDGSKYAKVTSTKEYGKQRAIFVNSNKDKTVVSREDWNLAEAMATAVLDDPFASSILRDCPIREEVFRWDDFGVKKKCRLDARGDDTLDVKTFTPKDGPTRPEHWKRSARRWGYYRQQPWYEDGLRAHGLPVGRFYFIAVSSKFPHPVFVCEEHPSWIERGRRENAEAVADIVRCRLNGKWRLDFQNQINQFSEAW